jgi:hypothetical protein
MNDAIHEWLLLETLKLWNNIFDDFSGRDNNPKIIQNLE